jgi:hypothetical protein
MVDATKGSSSIFTIFTSHDAAVVYTDILIHMCVYRRECVCKYMAKSCYVHKHVCASDCGADA